MGDTFFSYLDGDKNDTLQGSMSFYAGDIYAHVHIFEHKGFPNDIT